MLLPIKRGNPNLSPFTKGGLRGILLHLLAPFFLRPNPDKPERIATKAPRHKEELFIII